MKVKTAGVLTLLLSLGVTAGEYGFVDLEWRPPTQTVDVGETVEIGLYAVTNDGKDHSIVAVLAILDWEPMFLGLVGNINNGPYEWQESGFFDDSKFDDLNKTWLDGDALYLALAQFERPWPDATPEGFLITTMEFTALAETETTAIDVPLHAGQFSQSLILSGEIAGLDVLGSAGSAFVTIVPEPTTILLLLVGVGTNGYRRSCGERTART